MRRYRILGVDIVDQTMDEAVEDMQRLIAGEGPRSLFFVNAHTLNHTAFDPAFTALLNRATRVLGDGTGVRWAARMRGVRLKANLNGTDLLPALLERATGVRCFLLGTTPERIDAVLAGARQLFPGVHFVGAHHGYLDESGSQAVLEEIRRSKADLVLVAMGNPIQERWIDRHRDAVPGALFVAVGGLLEYWHGDLARAPSLMRRFGVEWAYLIVRQPRKMPRHVFGDPFFLVRTILSARRERAPKVPHG